MGRRRAVPGAGVTPAGARSASDEPVPSALELRSGAHTYQVFVEALCSQSLNRGLLEYSWEMPEFLEECTADSVTRFQGGLKELWPWAGEWTLVTPLPDYRDPTVQRSEVVEGRLCAAALVSYDASFPGVGGAQGADYSLASLIWTIEAREATFSPRVFSSLDWERIAKPALV